MQQSAPSPRLFSLSETQQQLCLSRTHVYRLIKSGELVAVRIGARTLVRDSDLQDFIERLAPAREPSPANDSH